MLQNAWLCCQDSQVVLKLHGQHTLETRLPLSPDMAISRSSLQPVGKKGSISVFVCVFEALLKLSTSASPQHTLLPRLIRRRPATTAAAVPPRPRRPPMPRRPLLIPPPMAIPPEYLVALVVHPAAARPPRRGTTNRLAIAEEIFKAQRIVDRYPRHDDGRRGPRAQGLRVPSVSSRPSVGTARARWARRPR